MNNRQKPLVGLTLMTEPEFYQAAAPLFDSGAVEVLEWTFDVGWGALAPPAWANEFIKFYSQKNRLLGHGVTFSPLSAQRTPRQDRWLECLKQECRRRNYRHVSEHFGWISAGNFHQSAPLPLPRTRETTRVGVENLKRLADAAQVPIGLENLAFAFGLADVREQGLFLEDLLAPVNGFLILDLHNIYCQAHNFQIPVTDLIETYPLERVRELHVSGGSWSDFAAADGQSEKVRRDTHDAPVPNEVFNLIELAIEKCPNVEFVIFEQIGASLAGVSAAAGFRDDFNRLKQLVAACF